MNNLRPWARWLVERRLKWLVLVVVILLFPAHLLVYLAPAAGAAFASWCDALRDTKNL